MKETASLIETPSTNESICDVELQESSEFWNEMIHDASPEEKKFIASPADIETHREIKLKDADVEPEQYNSLKIYVMNLRMCFQRIPLI